MMSLKCCSCFPHRRSRLIYEHLRRNFQISGQQEKTLPPRDTHLVTQTARMDGEIHDADSP